MVGGYPGKTRFKETVGTIVCDHIGIIEGPCGYSTYLVGTQGKLVFRETLCGTVGPRIDVFGACRSAFLRKTSQLCLASRASGLRFGGDPKGVVECPLGMRNGVWVFELNSFYQDLQVHGAIKTLKCAKVRAKDHQTAPHRLSSRFEILLGPYGCCRVSPGAWDTGYGYKGNIFVIEK